MDGTIDVAFGREVDNPVERLVLQKPRDKTRFRLVTANEAVSSFRLQIDEIRHVGRVARVCQLIEIRHMVDEPLTQHQPHEIRTDKTCTANDQ